MADYRFVCVCSCVVRVCVCVCVCVVRVYGQSFSLASLETHVPEACCFVPVALILTCCRIRCFLTQSAAVIARLHATTASDFLSDLATAPVDASNDIRDVVLTLLDNLMAIQRNHVRLFSAATEPLEFVASAIQSQLVLINVRVAHFFEVSSNERCALARLNSVSDGLQVANGFTDLPVADIEHGRPLVLRHDITCSSFAARYASNAAATRRGSESTGGHFGSLSHYSETFQLGEKLAYCHEILVCCKGSVANAAGR